MKRALNLLLSLVMAMTLISVGACAAESEAEQTSDHDPFKVVYCTMTSEGEYWQLLEELLAENFAKYNGEFEVVSADMDPVRQTEQITNAVTLGADLLIVLPVDPNAVADTCKKAMDSGVKVVTFIKDPGEGNRDIFYGIDEADAGARIVDMAMDWASKKFPDAEEGSINTIIVGGNSAGSETDRYEGMVAQAEKYPEINVLEAPRFETSETYAEDAIQNLLLKYNGDVNLLIVGSGEVALGCDRYIVSESSPIKDFSELGIFTGGYSDEILQDIKLSATDEDPMRGVIIYSRSNEENMQNLSDQCMLLINGEEHESMAAVSIYDLTVETAEELGY